MIAEKNKSAMIRKDSKGKALSQMTFFRRFFCTFSIALFTLVANFIFNNGVYGRCTNVEAGSYKHPTCDFERACPAGCYCLGGRNTYDYSTYTINCINGKISRNSCTSAAACCYQSDGCTHFENVYACPEKYPNSAENNKAESTCFAWMYKNSPAKCGQGMYIKAKTWSCVACDAGSKCPNTYDAGIAGDSHPSDTDKYAYYYSKDYGITQCTKGNCSATCQGSICNCTNGSGGTTCAACVTGSYADKDGLSYCKKASAGYCSTTDGKKCNTGYNGGTNQLECGVGTCSAKYGTGNKIVCSGTTTDATGSTQCMECPLGQYQDAKGQSKCKDADLGFCSVRGSNNGCSEDKTGATSQQKCSPGKCSSTDNKKCADTSKGASYFMNCPDGYYQDAEGQSTCKECKGEIERTDGRPTGCHLCDTSAGEVLQNGKCTQCGAGSYIKDGKCLDCPIGYTCGTDPTKDPVKCDPNKGEYASEDAVRTECSICPAGQYALYTSKCKHIVAPGKTCNNYLYKDVSAKCHACDRADLGDHADEYFQDDTNHSCQKCPTSTTLANRGGKLKRSDDNRKGIESCRYEIDNGGCLEYWKYSISKGEYALDSIQAPENQYVQTNPLNGAKTCVACPSDKPYSDGGSGNDKQCHKCEAGSCIDGKTENNPGYCRKCTGGFICPGDDKGLAVACKTSFTTSLSQASVTVSGAYGVLACDVNQFSNAGATKCTACAANYTTQGSSNCKIGGAAACNGIESCQIKATKLCYPLNSCNEWPECIIEGKIDRSVIKPKSQ